VVVGHVHGHERAESRRALATALGLTAVYTVVEVLGGLYTGSLALLADAVHMLSDNLAIALALVAAWLATRPATPGRSFGYKRAEVLAALANGVLLVALSIWIFVAAAQRLSDPPDVLGGWMLVIALVGIAVNLAAGAALYRSRGEPQRRGGLPPRARRPAQVVFGVLAAAVVILATGWLQADRSPASSSASSSWRAHGRSCATRPRSCSSRRRAESTRRS
jgi:cobalt-zinc-cadmium efflux system protein